MSKPPLISSSFWKQCYRGHHVIKGEENQVAELSIKAEAGNNSGQSVGKAVGICKDMRTGLLDLEVRLQAVFF